MAAIASLANALGQPVAYLARLAYHAPTVLLRGLESEQAVTIGDACRQLGFEVEAEPDEERIALSTDRFDVAVHIEDPAVIARAVETTSRVLGIDGGAGLSDAGHPARFADR